MSGERMLLGLGEQVDVPGIFCSELGIDSGIDGVRGVKPVSELVFVGETVTITIERNHQQSQLGSIVELNGIGWAGKREQG